MPRIEYKYKKFSTETLVVIDTANDILQEYEEDGLSVTLRQLYYQFVSRDLLTNTQKGYDRLGRIVSEGRVCGLIDWNHLEDRGRDVDIPDAWNSPAQIISASARGYQIDLWEGQPYRPEVWVEKEALIGVVERAAWRLNVPCFACKGYVSQSEMWVAGRRMQEHLDNGQEPIVIHLGDHDPSGIDMTRDINERLSMFAEENIEVRRIALNMDQVLEYGPPPNPTKLTDSRAPDYIAQFGYESWELDALDPKTLDVLIMDAVKKVRDGRLFDAAVEHQSEERKILRACSARWGDVVEFLNEES